MEPVVKEVGEIERALLRVAWWFFPLLGGAAAFFFARFGWWLISLDDAVINRDPLRALKLPYVLFVPAFAAIPLIWRIALSRAAGRQRAAWLLALFGVAAGEIVIRQTAVQRAVWLATRARSAGAEDFFERELANLRLNVLEDRADDPRRVIFAGTSQLILGINYDAAQRELPQCKICKRSVAGMVPLRMCSAQNYLSVRSNDVVVLYLSEFDLSGLDGFEANWIRPTASWTGARDVVAALPADTSRRAWRELADVAAAASGELWRCRDSLRMLALNLAGKTVKKNGAGEMQNMRQTQKEKYQRGLAANEMWAANMNALDLLLAKFKSRGARVVAFEGQVNPGMTSAESLGQRVEARQNLELLFQRNGFPFVPVSDQQSVFTAADFRDNTHLNESARDRFTEYVVTWLRAKTCKDWNL